MSDEDLRTLERAAAAGDETAALKLTSSRARLEPIMDPKAIHVRVWSGSGSALVTDMTNAGKRGKTCRTLRLSGPWERERHAGYGESLHFFRETLPGLTGYESFDDVALLCRAAVDVAGIQVHEESVRGVDAPRPLLLAGIDGVWSASADESGLSLADLTDRNNDPREITHDQTGARAYELARKVWPQVMKATTCGGASSILRAAGCRLHSYCAMD